MKKSIRILVFSLLCLATPFSWAQLYPPNAAGVSFASLHTVVRDVAATEKFWAIFDGKPMKIEGVDVVELPGALVFLHPGAPTGGTKGDLIDHVGVNCQNCDYLLKRLVDAGVKTDKINWAPKTGTSEASPSAPGRAWTYAYSPDGLRIEIETNPCSFRTAYKFLSAPQPGLDPCPESVAEGRIEDPAGAIGTDIVHFFMKTLVDAKGLNVFYKKYFGGRQLEYPNPNASVPGAVIYTSVVGNEGAGLLNKGGALDAIGFEVKNLEAFTKKLQADGVQFTQPYSKTRYKTFAQAEITDSWGTQVWLTEGLNRFITKAPRVASQEKQTAALTGAGHGKQIFQSYCGFCHNTASTDSQYGGAPGLKGLFSMPPHKLKDGSELQHTDPQIRHLIVQGNLESGGRMRPIAAFISSQELDDLMAYLKTL